MCATVRLFYRQAILPVIPPLELGDIASFVPRDPILRYAPPALANLIGRNKGSSCNTVINTKHVEINGCRSTILFTYGLELLCYRYQYTYHVVNTSYWIIDRYLDRFYLKAYDAQNVLFCSVWF